MSILVIPGCASWRRPGIHTPDRGNGFRARSFHSRPGMTRDMTDHYDALETRAPAEREADLFSRLPERAAQGDGSAGLCRAPQRHRPRRDHQPGRAGPPAGAAQVRAPCPAQGRPAVRRICCRALPARSDGCLHRPARSSSPRPPMPIPGAARGHCSRQASGPATWC